MRNKIRIWGAMALSFFLLLLPLKTINAISTAHDVKLMDSLMFFDQSNIEQIRSALADEEEALGIFNRLVKDLMGSPHLEEYDLENNETIFTGDEYPEFEYSGEEVEKHIINSFQDGDNIETNLVHDKNALTKTEMESIYEDNDHDRQAVYDALKEAYENNYNPKGYFETALNQYKHYASVMANVVNQHISDPKKYLKLDHVSSVFSEIAPNMTLIIVSDSDEWDIPVGVNEIFRWSMSSAATPATVNHTFKLWENGAPSSEALPRAVKDLTPKDITDVEYGTSVSPTPVSTNTVADGNYNYTFKEYTEESWIADAPTHTFLGYWERSFKQGKAKHTFKLTLEDGSISEEELPAEVTQLIPDDSPMTNYGSDITPTNPTETSVDVGNYTYTFTGYTEKTWNVNLPEHTFVGKWKKTIKKSQVTHSFKLWKDGKPSEEELPKQVKDQIPDPINDVEYGTTVEPKAPKQNKVELGDKVYTFKNYKEDSWLANEPTHDFEGYWEESTREATVTHTFKVVTGDGTEVDVPEEIKALIPENFKVFYGENAMPKEPSRKVVQTGKGIYSFQKYSEKSWLANEPTHNFVGTWLFSSGGEDLVAVPDENGENNEGNNPPAVDPDNNPNTGDNGDSNTPGGSGDNNGENPVTPVSPEPGTDPDTEKPDPDTEKPDPDAEKPNPDTGKPNTDNPGDDGDSSTPDDSNNGGSNTPVSPDPGNENDPNKPVDNGDTTPDNNVVTPVAPGNDAPTTTTTTTKPSEPTTTTTETTTTATTTTRPSEVTTTTTQPTTTLTSTTPSTGTGENANKRAKKTLPKTGEAQPVLLLTLLLMTLGLSLKLRTIVSKKG